MIIAATAALVAASVAVWRTLRGRERGIDGDARMIAASDLPDDHSATPI